MPYDRPASVDDVLSLAPLRGFFRKYRSYLTVGFIGIILFGILLVGSVWWLSPVTRIASIQLSLGFQGAQDGKYPNELPFSPEELLDTNVLRAVYEQNQLRQWIEFPVFQSSLSISQSAVDLEEILREYSGRLNDSKLAGPDRQALEEEYRSRLRSASSTLYTLAWYDSGTSAGVPLEVKGKVLTDIPSTWVEQSLRGKQVLTFPSRLPGLNPRAFNEKEANLEVYSFINSRARAMEDGLLSMEKLPGAAQVALPDGTTLIDLRLRLRAFREQTLPAIQEALLTRLVSERDARQLVQALELQLKFRENRAQSSRERLLGLGDTYRDFLAGRPGAGGITETGEPAAVAVGGLDENFFNRLLGLAQVGADRDYLKKMLGEIEGARLQLTQDEVSVMELRQNLELIRALLSRRPSERSPGSPLQPPPPSEDRAQAAGAVSLQDSAGQLGRLLDSSRQLVVAISEAYLGRKVDLFGIARGLKVVEVRPMDKVRLGLAFWAWGVLGAFSLGVLVLAAHRMSSLGRSVRAR